MTKIGKNAFASCRSLTEIKVSEENPNYKSIDGVLYNKDGTELLFCPPLKEKLLISNDVMYVEWNNIYISTMIQFEDAKLWGIENLEQKYSEGYNIELKQLYGEYFGEIRPKLNYLLSSENNIDRNFDIFLGRMILCLGKEEVQKIFEMPEISQEELKQYMLEKDEMFKELYETKYEISGDLGITIEVLRNLNFGKYKTEKNQKNNVEMQIFKEINEYLEAPNKEIITLLELIEKASNKIGIDLSQEDKEKIRELEKRLNGRIIEEGINKTKGKLEEEIGRQIVREQVKPIVIMVKEEIERQFKEDGKVDVEKIKRYLRERLMR